MKIVSVNLPVSYLNAIESLTGDEGLYPSRSELIRSALKDLLICHIDSAISSQNRQNQKKTKPEPEPKPEEEEEELYVDEDYITIGESTYRIIEK